MALLEQMPNAFANADLESGLTNWLAVSGAGTMFEIADESGFPIDGFSSTLMFVEADLDQAVEWTKPQDLLFDPANPTQGLSGLNGDGFYGAFADGNVEFFNREVNDASLVAVALREDGGFVDFGEFAPFHTPEESLSRLGLAMLNYESAHQELPGHAIYSDDGTPLLSWRVSILPFIEQNDLFDEFRLDEPWDSPHNIALLPRMPHIFATPDVGDGFTIYVTSNGEKTAFPFADEQVRLNSFVDGPANTALIVQARDRRPVEWTRPMDLMFDETNPRDGLNRTSQSGMYYVNAEGGLGFLPHLVGDGDVASLLQRNDEMPFVDFDAPATQFDLRQTLENRIRQAAIGALNYESVNRELPAHAIYSQDDTTPLLSWRVAILPFIGHQSLFDQFNLDESWDSENNLALLPLMPDVFAHPELANGLTSLLGVTGEGTVFPLRNQGTRLEGILDGSSNTLLFLQANADQAVEWTRPADLIYDELDPKLGTGELFATGTMIALADSSAHFLHDCIDPELMRNLILANDGNFGAWDAYCNNGTAFSSNIFGTQDDDVFQIDFLDEMVSVTVNGDETLLSREEFDQAFVDGLGGEDTLIIRSRLPEGDTTATYVEMQGTNIFYRNGETEFRVGNTEDNTVVGGEGENVAKLMGTESDDVFNHWESSSRMTGPGYSNSLVGFETIEAYGEEGNDTANLDDTAGDDEFVSDLDSGHLFSDTISVRVFGFYNTKVNSINGGFDTAMVDLTSRENASDDLAWVFPEHVRVTDTMFNVSMHQFDQVFVDGDLGQDVIRITDTAGDDVFVGQQLQGTFTSQNQTVSYDGFERVIVTSKNGGSDTASLTSEGNSDDRFDARFGLATLKGTEIDIRLVGFNSIEVQGGGGLDLARLVGSEGNDAFFATDSRATLEGEGYFYSVSGFSNVRATAGDGGNDTAVLRDTAGNERLTANWNLVTFFVNGQVNQAEGFDQVRAVSTGGNDLAVLNDSAGDDFFRSAPTFAYLAGDEFRNIANGFQRVIAYSTEGFDRATAKDSVGDDIFVGRTDFSSLRGDGYNNTGFGFAEFRVFATAGGNDSAFLFDSEEDDQFSGTGDTGWMRGAAHFYLTRGFDLIAANGVNGGVNKDTSRNVNYRLNLNGDWI
jgi:hypothetical protein